MTSNQRITIRMKMIAFHIISSTITGRRGFFELGGTHLKQTNEQTTKLALRANEKGVVAVGDPWWPPGGKGGA